MGGLGISQGVLEHCLPSGGGGANIQGEGPDNSPLYEAPQFLKIPPTSPTNRLSKVIISLY